MKAMDAAASALRADLDADPLRDQLHKYSVMDEPALADLLTEECFNPVRVGVFASWCLSWLMPLINTSL